MNDFEKEYQMFSLTDDMINWMKDYTVSIDENSKISETFMISSIVINATESYTINEEENNAELV